ncbi:MAG TPA: hypothetical protein PLR02_04650 [Rhodocyclaceae bacterium]|nr:hypothetical protein [Rhodocyclaceae bacterium]
MTVIQRTPNLGIKIKLQPEQQGCGCNATGVGWLVKPIYATGGEGAERWAEWRTPGLSTSEAVGMEDSGGFGWAEQPAPQTFIGTGVPGYYYNDLPAPPHVFAAAAIGPEVRGIQWSAERVGSAQFSIDIDTNGPVAWVTINPIMNPPAGYTTITLTARCGDSVVGRLRLQVRNEAA